MATATLLFFSSSCSSKHRRSPKTWKSWLSRKSSHQARLISSLIGSSNLRAWKIGAALHPPPATYHDAPQEPVTQLPSCHFKMKGNKKKHGRRPIIEDPNSPQNSKCLRSLFFVSPPDNGTANLNLAIPSPSSGFRWSQPIHHEDQESSWRTHGEPYVTFFWYSEKHSSGTYGRVRTRILPIGYLFVCRV